MVANQIHKIRVKEIVKIKPNKVRVVFKETVKQKEPTLSFGNSTENRDNTSVVMSPPQTTPVRKKRLKTLRVAVNACSCASAWLRLPGSLRGLGATSTVSDGRRAEDEPGAGACCGGLWEATSEKLPSSLGTGMRNCLQLTCREEVLQQTTENNLDKSSAQDAER